MLPQTIDWLALNDFQIAALNGFAAPISEIDLKSRKFGARVLGSASRRNLLIHWSICRMLHRFVEGVKTTANAICNAH